MPITLTTKFVSDPSGKIMSASEHDILSGQRKLSDMVDFNMGDRSLLDASKILGLARGPQAG